jgi:hypothetical protein
MWENPTQFAETVKKAYRKDYWETQPTHVEIWTEKDTIIGTIQEVTEKYGVAVRVNRGFSSATRAFEIAEYFQHLDDKRVVIFYLGDHDPSGIVIETELYKRLLEYGHLILK